MKMIKAPSRSNQICDCGSDVNQNIDIKVAGKIAETTSVRNRIRVNVYSSGGSIPFIRNTRSIKPPQMPVGTESNITSRLIDRANSCLRV